MVYTIHGKTLMYEGSECGIYKSPDPISRPEYAQIDMGSLVRTINEMPKEKAIEAVTRLKDQASLQAGWQHTPQNPGFPILRQTPGPSTSIDEVRGNIRNTERFCNDVLRALNGK